MVRKLFICILLLLCLSLHLVAEDKTATVRYHVDQSYTWEIHSVINFGSNAGVNQTVDVTAKIGSSDIGVRVLKNVIGDGKELVISLNDTNTFKVFNGNTTLDYQVSKTVGGEPLSTNSRVLGVPAGTNTANQPLYFRLITGSGAAEVAGHYRGTVSYTAQISDI